MNTYDEDFDIENEPPSKSQLKREMHALQELGKQLTELSEGHLLSLDLPEEVLSAVQEMHRIRQREAKRRHLQFIGKVMRKVDSEHIAQQLESLNARHSLNIHLQHQVESWRDQLMAGDQNALQQFIDKYPSVDIQHLRQLMRVAQKEKNIDKAPTHARKLFRYLRDVVLASQ
ncbi:ribosome biogenesis factor YjgA [Gilvimarinus sp. SDUM040013]|uniref:Dual-action ribosomal maturation protein DarP n=1 Tax=Gilvimarinus gilvus TaxID=3058038 RepID=A0ABU4RUS8_9GAMM|nr:ribosome biogenesis factor YjgA [Gilvimarinus sp. SDUM040013]MDO3388357.1 ribosome biogenesis factor YjgA [Gilvimarinus sp. SDUM040013]MDX6847907.1 ribosome biogenesis factor YjgA [Gilvimarinus sp. SDUM040013]